MKRERYLNIFGGQWVPEQLTGFPKGYPLLKPFYYAGKGLSANHRKSCAFEKKTGNSASMPPRVTGGTKRRPSQRRIPLVKKIPPKKRADNGSCKIHSERRKF